MRFFFLRLQGVGLNGCTSLCFSNIIILHFCCYHLLYIIQLVLNVTVPSTLAGHCVHVWPRCVFELETLHGALSNVCFVFFIIQKERQQTEIRRLFCTHAHLLKNQTQARQ